MVNTITVQPQSSGSFTVRYFTTIQIVTTGTGVSQGQLCLTVRYPFHKQKHTKWYAFYIVCKLRGEEIYKQNEN